MADTNILPPRPRFPNGFFVFHILWNRVSTSLALSTPTNRVGFLGELSGVWNHLPQEVKAKFTADANEKRDEKHIANLEQHSYSPGTAQFLEAPARAPRSKKAQKGRIPSRRNHPRYHPYSSGFEPSISGVYFRFQHQNHVLHSDYSQSRAGVDNPQARVAYVDQDVHIQSQPYLTGIEHQITVPEYAHSSVVSRNYGDRDLNTTSPDLSLFDTSLANDVNGGSSEGEVLHTIPTLASLLPGLARASHQSHGSTSYTTSPHTDPPFEEDLTTRSLGPPSGTTELRAPSPFQVVGLCPHFGLCEPFGGCDLFAPAFTEPAFALSGGPEPTEVYQGDTSCLS
ncbi:hypothetical protein NLI96_g7207 [Meripilus lineatus]|uniref:Uncharacterized protein n=1 Tax=Meripilus lineatus TaxID=2056292 RepID=A0AAD5V1D3_9APHY|nr:hypothetical protein NLI96_g7207 [Physisporinus lineatus]